ncbi:hypothetical protein EPN15_03355 [Patescibacteria group bacterium]|nr:MAG: hypothetical protein EPN15_03355 [Patescibacteria group bacterium]
MNRIRKIILYGLGGLTVLAFIPLFAAFEAHVINVTAQIENALFVHPESLEYGTVFPQEHLNTSFFVTFSESFSESSQTRVGTIEYAIKQKPKPLPAYVAQIGVDSARAWCHDNYPQTPYDPAITVWQDYLSRCYPTICPALSKHPDNNPSTGPNANNDIGLPAFHNPWTEFAIGKLVKFPNINNDPADTWTIDLAVPCFKGQCAQDWPNFVLGQNPNAGDPLQYELPPELEHQTFGCDLWVEVTKIY